MDSCETFAKELCDSMSRVAKFGVEAGKQIERQKVDAVLMAYDLALKNPEAKIPTILQVTIEALRK